MSLLALLAAIPVRIVNADGGGLQWRDVLVPLGTLLAGVVGVTLGAWFSRNTLFTVENAKAQRDEQFEIRREARQRAIEQREMRGVARVLVTNLQDAQRIIRTSVAQGAWWPDGFHVAPDLQREGAHLLASELSDAAWDTVAVAIQGLAMFDRERATAAATFSPGLDPQLMALDEPDRLSQGIPWADQAIATLSRLFVGISDATAAPDG